MRDRGKNGPYDVSAIMSSHMCRCRLTHGTTEQAWRWTAPPSELLCGSCSASFSAYSSATPLSRKSIKCQQGRCLKHSMDRIPSAAPHTRAHMHTCTHARTYTHTAHVLVHLSINGEEQKHTEAAPSFTEGVRFCTSVIASVLGRQRCRVQPFNESRTDTLTFSQAVVCPRLRAEDP